VEFTHRLTADSILAVEFLLSNTPEDVLEEMDTSTLDERIVSLVGSEYAPLLSWLFH
jgi:hypothetical protein